MSIIKSLKESKKAKCFLIAGVVVITCFVLWLMTTHTGLLARTSFFKTFDPEVQQNVTVYGANGEILRRYEGNYDVEHFKGHYTILNLDDETRVDLYGDVVVIIDEPQKNTAIETTED